MNNIGIIGAGAIGSALARALARAGATLITKPEGRPGSGAGSSDELAGMTAVMTGREQHPEARRLLQGLMRGVLGC